MRLVRDKETDKFKGKLKFGTADALLIQIRSMSL